MTKPVSVIIATHNAETVIIECLTRLRRQGGPENMEIIVADSSEDETPQLIEKYFPDVLLLRFERETSLPELRGQGIARSEGNIIAILDPYSMVMPNWLVELSRVHKEQRHPVIGGYVDLIHPEQHGLLDWAQYINEYGMFLSPVEEGEIEILPGSNISYKRAVLFDGNKPRYEIFWKTFVNAGLKESGSVLWQSPAVGVELWKPVGFASFFLTRFAHGRCYAGTRCAGSGLTTRILRLISSPLLPFVLQYRWTRRYWSKKRYRIKFILTIPLQFLLFSYWSLGEFTGYMAGPGDCCRKLYY